ncbi:hypothetical protein C1T17_07870 [Sphingobium sp. SCG-1]|uniref:plasmid mobilization protein n=1 Tax=Sphingobium sp. SCG-1 TaxID=2072936 RepID=UPI000CD67503|nr:hypothetical protein [Sphingobium sp. SCG-1]AUW58034.1 hypothetical protein C1T17_07870 [Sphingobium sp. SCG-1]
MAKPPCTVFVSVRLTFEEKARLDQDAAGVTTSSYLRSRIFDSHNPSPRRRGKSPVKDHQLLAQLLGKLGESRLSSNLNQLARMANSGSLPVTPDTEAALISAAFEVKDIRRILLVALNLEP